MKRIVSEGPAQSMAFPRAVTALRIQSVERSRFAGGPLPYGDSIAAPAPLRLITKRIWFLRFLPVAVLLSDPFVRLAGDACFSSPASGSLALATERPRAVLLNGWFWPRGGFRRRL